MQKLIMNCSKDIEVGIFNLEKIEPKFCKAVSVCGLPKLTKASAGFTGLFKIIIDQQLSTAAAKSIWSKVIDNGLTTADAVLKSDDATLHGLGLSRAKISYAKGLASAGIDYDLMKEKSDKRIIQELTEIRGIGLWTAQIFLIFSLRRQDVFPSSDLALQEGVRALFEKSKRPTPVELDAFSRSWQPVRSIAAMLLWNYYTFTKKKRG